MNTSKKILIIFIGLFFVAGGASRVSASQTNGTIITVGNNGFAWSNNAGWINFGLTNGSIAIVDPGTGPGAGIGVITGHAWSSQYGWINMAPTNGGVRVSATGVLSGFAWGAGLGWINFSGVSIDATGKFNGQATGVLAGTIIFSGSCTNCSVKTDYIPFNFRPFGGGGGIVVPGQLPGTGGPVVPPVVPPITVPPTLVPPTPGPSPVQPTTFPPTSGPGTTAAVSGPSLSGSGTLGIGDNDHVYAFDVPLVVKPAQFGTLAHDFSNEVSVAIETPKNVYSDEITFMVKEEKVSWVSTNSIPQKMSLVGGVLFNVTAWDKKQNQVRKFLKPIQIVLKISDLLKNKNGLSVYFFDETTKNWVKIPEAVFGKDTASFYVDHLTVFAIFAAEQSENIVPLSVEDGGTVAFDYRLYFSWILILIAIILFFIIFKKKSDDENEK